MLPGPPALYQTLLEHPDRASADLSSLRLAVTGAASIPVSLIRRMHDDLGFDTVRTAYGLTEATGTVTMCRAGDDADGWLWTGDVVVMDDRGYLDIVDRTKDMFIVGGFNAYPAEIENLLVEHPGIAQAAVVGMPDERLGEVGCAFVVPSGGASLDPDEVIAWSRDTMANFKVPRRVEVVDTLPRNPSGKVLKHELRDRVA